MKKRNWVFVIIFIFNSVIFIFSAAAAEKNFKPIIIEIKGTVEVSMDTDKWQPAKNGMTINQNNSIRTGEKSRVKIKFDEESFSEIGEKALMRLETLEFKTVVKKTLFSSKEIPSKNIKINMAGGSILSKLKKLNTESGFSIKTQTAVCGVRGTSFDVSSGDNSDIAVLEGEVEVANPQFPDQIIRVKKNEQVNVKPNAVPSQPAAIPQEKLNKLIESLKTINKDIETEEKTGIVNNSFSLLNETPTGNEYEYSVDIKNIDSSKAKIYLVILNEKNEEVNAILMKCVQDSKNYKDIKKYSAKYIFSVEGKFSHKFRIKK